ACSAQVARGDGDVVLRYRDLDPFRAASAAHGTRVVRLPASVARHLLTLQEFEQEPAFRLEQDLVWRDRGGDLAEATPIAEDATAAWRRARSLPTLWVWGVLGDAPHSRAGEKPSASTDPRGTSPAGSRASALSGAPANA